MSLPTLADRVWFAYHCLPRDHDGTLPSYRSLEDAYGLSQATFSKTVTGVRTQHARGTLPKMAEALRVTTKWLDEGKGRGPTLPLGISVPPRPGGAGWTRHGDVPGWSESVRQALLRDPPVIPPEAFLAGADLPVYRSVHAITAELATWIAGYAWETSSPAQQTKYSTQWAKSLNVKATNGPLRRVKRPAVR